MRSRIQIVVLILGLLAGVPASADDSAFSWGSWTYTLTAVNFDAPDRHLVVGASAEAKLHVTHGVHAFASAEASAIQDGGAVRSVEITDPSTFSTLELWGGAYRGIRKHLGVVGLWSLALPIDAGQLVVLERYPMSYGGGLVLGELGGGSAWCMALVGAHEASGTGARLLGRCRVPLEGRMAAVADGVLGGTGSFVRFGVAVRVR